jgi:hypothetical protein
MVEEQHNPNEYNSLLTIAWILAICFLTNAALSVSDILLMSSLWVVLGMWPKDALKLLSATRHSSPAMRILDAVVEPYAANISNK